MNPWRRGQGHSKILPRRWCRGHGPPCVKRETVTYSADRFWTAADCRLWPIAACDTWAVCSTCGLPGSSSDHSHIPPRLLCSLAWKCSLPIVLHTVGVRRALKVCNALLQQQPIMHMLHRPPHHPFLRKWTPEPIAFWTTGKGHIGQTQLCAFFPA